MSPEGQAPQADRDEPEGKGASPGSADPDKTIDLGMRPESSSAASGEGDATLDLGSRKEAPGAAPASSPPPGPAAPNALTAESLEGKTIGDYRVLQKLGQGGMGFVLKAHDQTLNRFVALKLLHPHMAANETFVQQFKVEAEALAKLNHPNVVPVYNFGTTDELVYFSMQFIRGYELGAMLVEQGQVAPRTMVETMIPVVEGLVYTHGYGILHRDLKPANIMIDEASKRPVVTDFGLAKMDVDIVQRRIDPDGSMSLDVADVDEDALLGTPAYMAPELFAPDIYQGEEAQADIYAIGVIMYQMLTGSLPFGGSSVSDIFKNAVSQQLAAIGEFVPRPPPPGLERCVLKALARDPKDRYPSMDRLLTDLNEVRRQWVEAAEIEKKAKLSSEMAMAMSMGGVSHARGGTNVVRRFMTVGALLLAAFGIMFVMFRGGGPGDGGGGGDGSDSAGSRATDESWEVGATVRVLGQIDLLDEVDGRMSVHLLDLASDTDRVAVFEVSRQAWGGQSTTRDAEEGDTILLVGYPRKAPDEDGLADFDPVPDGVWVIPLSRPSFRLKSEDGAQSVAGIPEELVGEGVIVTGTVVGVYEDVDTGAGGTILDLQLHDPSGDDEDDQPLTVSFIDHTPRTSGGRDVRLGDSLSAHGVVVGQNLVEVSDPDDIAQSTISGSSSQ